MKHTMEKKQKIDANSQGRKDEMIILFQND